jgi:flagellar motor switch protein FliM
MGRKGHSIAVRVDTPLASTAKRRLTQLKRR